MSNSEYPGDLILEMLLVNLFFIFIALVYVLIHSECLMQCFCTVLHCSRHFFQNVFIFISKNWKRFIKDVLG